MVLSRIKAIVPTTQQQATTQQQQKSPQYSTFEGVFKPTLLTILEAIIYLRLGWGSAMQDYWEDVVWSS